MSLNRFKYKHKSVPNGDVPSLSEPKPLKSPEEKSKKSNKRESLDKIDFVLHEYYYAVIVIGSYVLVALFPCLGEMVNHFFF